MDTHDHMDANLVINIHVLKHFDLFAYMDLDSYTNMVRHLHADLDTDTYAHVDTNLDFDVHAVEHIDMDANLVTHVHMVSDPDLDPDVFPPTDCHPNPHSYLVSNFYLDTDTI